MNKNLKVILVALVTICIVGTLAFSDINGSYAISKIDDLGKIDDNIVEACAIPKCPKTNKVITFKNQSGIKCHNKNSSNEKRKQNRKCNSKIFKNHGRRIYST